MKHWRPKHPAKAVARRAIARRRVGRGARCQCGESRPEALIRGSRPVQCADCQRKATGQSTIDDHHIAGRNNGPLTIPVNVNDHRAELSRMQMDWSPTLRENPDRDPIVATAASLRGAADVTVFVTDKCVDPVIARLEALAVFLRQRLGKQWWRGTPFEKFAPKD